MIYLKSVTLTNFLSHSNSIVEFNEDEKLLISGMSGAGKSSIIEAISWGLYGKGRSDNRNLIKRGANQATVSIDLFNDEFDKHLEYHIIRSVNDKGKQELLITKTDHDIQEEEEMTKKSIKETQEWLEKELLRASYTLFVNSIESLQENPELFVNQPASKRKDLLLEIVGIEDYDFYYNKAKTELSIIESTTERLIIQGTEKQRLFDSNSEKMRDLDQLENKNNELEKFITNQSELLNATVEKKHKIEIQLNSKKELENSLSLAQKELVSLKNELFEKTTDLNRISYLEKNNNDIKKGLETLEEVKEKIIQKEIEVNNNYTDNLKYTNFLASKPAFIDYDSEIRQLKAQYEKIVKNSDAYCDITKTICPKLQKNIQENLVAITDRLDKINKEKDSQKENIEKWNNEYLLKTPPQATEELQIELKSLKGVLSGLQHFETDMATIGANKLLKDELSSTIEGLNSKIEKSSNILNELTEKYENVNNIDLISYQQLEDLIIKYKNELDKARTDKEQILLKLSIAKTAKDENVEIEKELKKNHDALSSCVNQKNSLSLIKEAFSPRGIKAMVIDCLVPTLEDRINNILKEMSDFRIRIDTQKNSADGDSVIEGLFINIINGEGQILEYGNYSGGEKMKLDYAISEALASLSHIKFRILDETIGGLDDDMLASFLKIIEEINKNYKQLIVISHIGQVKDNFYNQITVNKINGNSIIEK